MTQDEIIRMAREAGGDPLNSAGEPICFRSENLERFAALVAAHVTKTLTKSHEEAFQSYVDQAKADRELEALAARLAEREACAKVCEELINEETCYVWIPDARGAVNNCAAAIRARGLTKSNTGE